MPPASLPPPLPTLWMSPFPPEPPPPPEPPRPRYSAEVGTVTPYSLWIAMSNEFRWRVVQRLAAGEELTAPQAAKGTDLRMSTVRKHLGYLRQLGVADSKPGTDRRSEVYYIRAARRPEPGVLDFGACRIILADVPKPRS